MDIASSLAILQEEVLLGQPSRDWRRNGEALVPRQANKGNSFSHSNKHSSPTIDNKKSASSVKTGTQDDKLSALMAYKKAKGLC